METLSFTSNVFTGEDTYGTHVEAAVNEQGKWFCRFRKYNGYGMGWTKWEEWGRVPEVYLNEYGQETIKWGWNKLTGMTAKRKLP